MTNASPKCYGDIAAREGDIMIFMKGNWRMISPVHETVHEPAKWVLAIKNEDEPVPFGKNAMPIVFTTQQDAENAAKLRCDVVAVKIA